MKLNSLLLAFLVCLVGYSFALAQGSQTAPGPRSGLPTSTRGGTTPSTGTGGGARVGPDVIMSADEDYQLAPSDVIEVVVDDAPELSVSYRINKSGSIPLRYLGAMNVAGKTCEEVSKAIADGLRGRYLKDPKVFVTVKQYNSRSFFIQGAVKNPGVYVIEGKPSLFKLITIAGGLQDNHSSTAYIFRETKAKPETLELGARAARNDTATNSKQNQLAKVVDNAKGNDADLPVEGEAEYELLTANIGNILRGRLNNNLIIHPSDVVYVPPADVFYVAGEVRAPGQYQLKQGITVRQAISLAQGTYFKAKLDKGVIFREDPLTGKFTEISVNIGSIMSGKSEDMPLLPNDVIWVPNSAMKAFGSVFLQSLTSSALNRVILGTR